MRRARLREEVARLEAEIADARPFLALAREIRDEVTRVGVEGGDGDRLVDALAAVPTRERIDIARAVFEQLTADQQWALIEHVFGDEEIRQALQAQRDVRLAEARRDARRRPLIDTARAEGSLATGEIVVGDLLTLGLFREAEVTAAIGRGHTSTACARRLVLRRVAEAGTFQVIEDVFNPVGGYFISGDYDEETWRTRDRLPPHSRVRAGSIIAERSVPTFEPILYLGGRADFEMDGELIAGRLHLGYAMIGDVDVFAGRERVS